MRPLRAVSIATEIHGRGPALDLERRRREPAYSQRPHPTGKRAGVDDFRLVPAARSEERCPRLEIQSWRSGKAGGPEYRCLRGRRRLGMTSAADIAAPGGTIQRAHELLVPNAIDHQLDECGRTSRRGAGVLCLQVVVQV